MKWQLNLYDIDGEAILTVNTDIKPKVSHRRMIKLILRYTGPMILNNEHGGGITFMANMTQKAKHILMLAAGFEIDL